MLEDVIATGDPVAVADFVRWNHPSTWWTGEEPDKPALVLFDEQNMKDPRGTVVNVWHELHGATMIARQDVESRLMGETSESISLIGGGSYENVVEATTHIQVKIGEQENETERRLTVVLRKDSSQVARECGHTLGLKFGESDFHWWSPTRENDFWTTSDTRYPLLRNETRSWHSRLQLRYQQARRRS